MDWLPITAFVVSLLALSLSGINSWVNYRNRADNQSVWLTLIRGTGSVVIGDGRHSIKITSWTLRNAGEASVMAPKVTLTLRDGRECEFTTSELVAGKSTCAIDMSSERLDLDKGGSGLEGAAAVAQWVGANGKTRRSRVTVQDDGV